MSAVTDMNSIGSYVLCFQYWVNVYQKPCTYMRWYHVLLKKSCCTLKPCVWGQKDWLSQWICWMLSYQDPHQVLSLVEMWDISLKLWTSLTFGSYYQKTRSWFMGLQSCSKWWLLDIQVNLISQIPCATVSYGLPLYFEQLQGYIIATVHLRHLCKRIQLSPRLWIRLLVASTKMHPWSRACMNDI